MKLVAAILVLGAVASPSLGYAQAPWPAKPVTLIVPYAPGGYTDSVGRITARYMEKALGQTVLVENKAGAGGIVGTQYVATAAADGYTLCMCSIGAVSVAPVAQKVQYDPRKDLSPISIVSTIPQTVIVKKALPINSVADLVGYAKARPDVLNYGSSGAGGLMHYSVALFEVRAGIKMKHVPFKGGAPATAAVVSGEVDLSFTNMTDALPQMEAGTVKAIAVTSSSRSAFAPKLPTIAESGFPGFTAESWNAVMAPAGTPAPVVERLAAIYAKMAQDPDVKEAMGKIGASTVATTPAEFKQRIVDEMEQWTALVKEFQKK